MTKPCFFESTACRSGVHCETCRNRDHGRAWRDKLRNAFRIPEINFDCPYGREWDTRYPVPNIVNQCALAESTGVKVRDDDCNCRTWRFLCHWPRYRAWAEARGIDPRARNVSAVREFLTTSPIPKRWSQKPSLDHLVRVSAEEKLGLVTVRTCERCPMFVPV